MPDSLHAQIRKKAGRGESHRLRNQSKVPGVIYGLNDSNMLVEFAELELFEVLHTNGDHGVIDIDVNGNKQKVMIKEVQRAPLTRRVTHIDAQRVDEKSNIKTTVPIKITGDSRYINTNDVVQIQINEVEVEGRAGSIPSHFTADISKVPPGGRFTIADLEISDEITVHSNPNTVIALITKVKNKPTESSSNEISLIFDTPDNIQAQ
jgi:large subunit ribosomal protein L25